MTPHKQLAISLIASEVDPYAKTGGLGDVTRSLAKALKRLGHTIMVIAPLYATIETKDLKLVLEKQELKIDKTKKIKYNLWKGYLMHDLPIYFIEEKEYLSKSKKIYGTGKDGARFFIFDHCALDALKKIEFKPQIINCHDWQAGLVPYLLTHKYAKDVFFKNTASVFTLHNLAFQSGVNWWEVPPKKKDNGRGGLPSFKETQELEYINFAKRGIRNANMINTVSEQYAKEIITKKFGQELHRILKYREDQVVGIINGIDYRELNPSTDPGLIARYDHSTLHNKTKNKVWLQEQLGLTVNPKIPLIAWTHRLAEQKGIELLIDILDPLLRLDVQLVVLGAGEKKYQTFFEKIAKQYPKKLFFDLNYIQTGKSSFEYNNEQETRLFAGSDIFIMPSRFEPCGIGQLKSMRYGSIPVVHKVGGLADTVQNYQTRTGKGNGFVFETYDSRDMLVALVRALENHKHRDTWLALVRKAMQQSYSWEIPAQKYEELFMAALEHKRTSKK